jgi:hypothetical protein
VAGKARSVPVWILSEPSTVGAQRGSLAPPDVGGEDEAVVLPHEVLACHTSIAHITMLEGTWRMLKGHDLHNAVLHRLVCVFLGVCSSDDHRCFHQRGSMRRGKVIQ